MTDPLSQAAKDPGPTLTRFLERHPGLRVHVERVLTQAAEVREAKARAFEGGIPEPVLSPSHRRCRAELEAAVAVLAALAESAWSSAPDGFR